MLVTVALPTTGPTASPSAIVRSLYHAEEVGLERLWTVDRLLRPADGSAYIAEHYKWVYDPLETLAWTAAQTERIGLGTSIVLLPFQNPVVLARRLATLDHLSSGRLLVGLGLGHVPQEFALTGVPMRERGARFEEGIAAMRATWGPDPVEFTGRFTQIPLADIGPKPFRPGGPTLIVGGVAPAALRRAGRLGLGINPVLDTYEQLRGRIELWRTAARVAGHDPDGLDVVVRSNLVVGERRSETRVGFAAWPRDVLVGDLRALETIGVTEIFYELRSASNAVEALIDELVAVRSALAS